MSLCDASGEDASGPQIAGSVVAFVKGVDLHTAGGAGVDELTAAQIDAHVADAAEGIEKYQITGLPLLGGDRCGGVILVAGPVGQGVAELGEHSHGEAGAVSTGIAGAAVDIGRSQIGVGVGDELLPHGVGGGSTLIVGIVDRLGILGGDVAGGLAEGYLVPAVLIVVEAGRCRW